MVAPPSSIRAGAVTSRSTRPPAVSRTALPVTGVGPFRSYPSTASTRYGLPDDPHGSGAVVGVDDPDPDLRPVRDVDRHHAGRAVHRGRAVVHVQDRQLVEHVGIRRRRGDHQRPEEPALDLGVRDLVRVVPVRADLVGDEPVGVRLPHRHRVLRDAGDAVLGVGDVDAVPVQGHAVRHRRVDQPDLDELPLHGVDHRAGRRVVDGVAVDLLAGSQPEPLLAHREGDLHVGRTVGVGDQVGDAASPSGRGRSSSGSRRRSRRTPCPSPSSCPAAGWPASSTPTGRGRRRRRPGRSAVAGAPASS